jgi:hypothetical protein
MEHLRSCFGVWEHVTNLTDYLLGRQFAVVGERTSYLAHLPVAKRCISLVHDQAKCMDERFSERADERDETDRWCTNDQSFCQ